MADLGAGERLLTPPAGPRRDDYHLVHLLDGKQ